MKLFKMGITHWVLRFLYYLWNLIDGFLRKNIFSRVRVRGIVSLQIEEIKFRMYSNGDDGIVDELYYKKRDYSELNEIKLFKELSKKSNVIFDIGANTGLYSIVSKLSNHQSTIFSFEPYSTNFDRLQKNISLNGLTNKIYTIKNAVGPSDSEVEFAVPENDQICDVLSADTEFTNRFYKEWISYKNITVSQISLDNFISVQKIKSVDLIKIDVENYELMVLCGGLKLLKENSPVILIEIFVDPERIDFYDQHLKPLEYYCYAILQEGIIRIDSLFENMDCRNFIFSKKRSATEYISFSNMPLLISQII